MGHILFTLDRFKEALPFFERAFVIRPQSNSALGYIGVTYARLNNYEEALRYLNGLLKLSPDSPSALNNIAFVKINQGLYEEALALLEKAIKIAPQGWDAYNNRGYIYFKLGGKENMKKAMADYDKAIGLAPSYYEPYWKYRELISL